MDRENACELWNYLLRYGDHVTALTGVSCILNLPTWVTNDDNQQISFVHKKEGREKVAFFLRSWADSLEGK